MKLFPRIAARQHRKKQSFNQSRDRKNEKQHTRQSLKPTSLFRRSLFDVLLVAGFAIGSLAVVARLALQPKNPAEGVAVVFSPWTNAAEALAQATAPGSRFVRYGGYPFIVVVIPDDPGYVSRISAQGALFVLDPKTLAACLPGASQEGNPA